MGTRAVFVRNGPDRVAGGDKGNPNRIFQLPPVVDRGCLRFVVGGDFGVGGQAGQSGGSLWDHSLCLSFWCGAHFAGPWAHGRVHRLCHGC